MREPALMGVEELARGQVERSPTSGFSFSSPPARCMGQGLLGGLPAPLGEVESLVREKGHVVVHLRRHILTQHMSAQMTKASCQC